MNHTETGGIQSFKVNARPSLLNMSQNAFLNDKKGQSTWNVSNLITYSLLFIYCKDFSEASLSFIYFFYTNFAVLGAPRKISNDKWKSVKVSITVSFLHKLIKLHNLVKAGHKHDVLLAISNTVFTRARTPNLNNPHKSKVEWTA